MTRRIVCASIGDWKQSGIERFPELRGWSGHVFSLLRCQNWAYQ